LVPCMRSSRPAAYAIHPSARHTHFLAHNELARQPGMLQLQIYHLHFPDTVEVCWNVVRLPNALRII
jgi:hypothetical protein